MKRQRYLAAAAVMLAAVLTVGSAAQAMLSEDEQKEAYVKKAVEKALSQQTEKESETEAETETDTGMETETDTETGAETETEAEEEGEEKIIVALDPAHQAPREDLSGTEPIGPGSETMVDCYTEGSRGCETGIWEYELNLQVAQLLEKELESRGYEVVMTRESNEVQLSNAERSEIAADSGAQILIQIHTNDSEDSSAYGAKAMAPTSENLYTQEICKRSNALALLVLDSYCEKTGLTNQGLWLSDEMPVMNWSEIPVMILEMGYMSNPQNDVYMAEEENQKLMAEGIADGIDLYFGR